MNVLDIINGHVKHLFNLEEELSNSRLKICHKCPLYTNKAGGMCNKKLWINVNTGDVSFNKKEGYQNGCGCVLPAKTRLTNAKCPIGKW